MAGPVYIHLAQQPPVVVGRDHMPVGLLVLWHDKAVADRVQGKHRHGELAVEDDVGHQVAHGRWVGADPRRAVQRLQVCGEVQSRSLVQPPHLCRVGRLGQVRGVVQGGVP